MQNMAGDPNCDQFIREELEAAGIEIVEVPQATGEVPYTLKGHLNGWTFTRLWYYWWAEAEDGSGIPAAVAKEFNLRWRNVVRVYGYAGGTEVARWLDQGNTLSRYHIDTQEGLNAFAALVRLFCEPDKK